MVTATDEDDWFESAFLSVEGSDEEPCGTRDLVVQSSSSFRHKACQLGQFPVFW